ncbi:conserved hypothetical protein [Roseibium sp. TrichSKD4]|uniref:hypothetical protein n=1 Tax=Roseibium sp. TrichSKD4 TaxID=744980 RepID=UPI0001E569B7|nr:hypothetical protein [Roseibium sp. TrichSKD4]EFO32490.1 conserved hypothetical protein [Roseibium sp. TrichSKD4]
MAFRADEAANHGFERVKKYLIPRSLTASERSELEIALLDIVDKVGPVVDGYPTWHPLVSNHNDRQPETWPNERCGYRGLDHTVCFMNGFLTCPYGNGQQVLDSVLSLPAHPRAEITAERLEVPFYNEGVTPILVRCEWLSPLTRDNMIPKPLAVPLMLEKELPVWRWADRAERWEVMRPYLLGSPHGARSSLFVDQETALAIKKCYLSMVESGMFGPLKMS